ncbi:MAG TPA: CHASE3 domain-containing protein [bacterium]|nr:CHASE3 domain-containing protein [bacterium]
MNPTSKTRTKKLLFWLGLSLPMVALLAMTWLVHQSSGQFNNSFNWVMQTYKVLDLFEQTQAHIVDTESNQRGYLLTGREEYLEPYRNALQATRDDIAQLKKLTASLPAQQAHLALLEKMVDEDLVFDPATAFADGHSPASTSVVALTDRGKRKLERMRRVLFESHQEQQQALVQHQQQAEDNVVSSQVMSLVLIVAVALSLILVVVILLRLEKLQEFVTVCAWTGQVRFQGEWLRLDEYLRRQFGISVSHSLSQEAADKMKREIEELNRKSPPSDD